MNQKATKVYLFQLTQQCRLAHEISFGSELVLYFEGIFASCVKNEESTPMLKLCVHLEYFDLFVGTRVQLLDCIFVTSKRLIEFDLFCL